MGTFGKAVPAIGVRRAVYRGLAIFGTRPFTHIPLVCGPVIVADLLFGHGRASPSQIWFAMSRLPHSQTDGALRPEQITGYHAHVYYDPASTRDRAALLREQVAVNFPDARLGRWHDEPVGPHPQAMYQIRFAPDRLSAILPWLMLNRCGLTILVHPEAGDDYADHAQHAAWLGATLPLRLEVLQGSR
jgi:aromatic ring-cleaving dioxygenase